MHRKIRVMLSLLTLLLFVCSAVVADKKALTNADVVKMVKGGLPNEVIIEAIKGSEQDFDVSADGLIALKQQGVPDAVIQAMVARANPNKPSADADSNPLMAAYASYSVVMIDGANRIELKQGYSGNRTSGGGMKVLNPFGKIKSQHVINGKQAELRTGNPSPTFEVGIASQYRPSDHILLVKLDVKSDRREVTVASARFSASMGINEKDRIPLTYSETQQSTTRSRTAYLVTPVKPLPAGEYALVLGMGGTGVLYDFGVDGK